MSFSSKLLHKMKFNIFADARVGVTNTTKNEVLIISKNATFVDKSSSQARVNNDSESVMINTKTGIVKPLTTPDCFIVSANYGRGTFLTASQNMFVQKWKNRRIVNSIQLEKFGELLLKVINDTKIAAAIRNDVVILNHELETVTEWQNGFYGEATAIDANERYLAVANDEGSVLFFCLDVASFEDMGMMYDDKQESYCHDKWVNSLAITGSTLASASDDNYVHVWDMSAETEMFRLKHDDSVTCVAFHNELIVSSCSDNSVSIWDKSTGQLRHSLTHQDECYNFDISPNGTLLAVAHYEGLSIWSFDGNYDKLAELDLGDVRDARFQTDDTIVAGCHDGKVFLVSKN